MTLLSALDAPAASQPIPAPAPTGPPPAISANRRRLDNRFPVLAFAVRTHGRPWFEVLLTTDRSLFDPANAAKRTPANFYAGRQDGGLARATADETAYVVPAAVLRRFAAAIPRPAEIFFTAAAYDRPDGPPVLAQPVTILATTAPSVALSRDFHAQAMAVVLGVPADKLQPVDADPSQDPGAVGQDSAALEDDLDPAAMAFDATPAEAEQGYASPFDYDVAAEDVDPSTNGHVEAQSLDDEDHGVILGYETDLPSNGEVAAQALDEPEVDAAMDYDDGYDTAQAEDNDWSEAAASTYPEGAAEPEQLADADDQRLDDELAMAASDLEPYDVAQAYAARAQDYADEHGYGEEQDYADEQGYGEEQAYADEQGYGEEQAYADEQGYGEEQAYADDGSSDEQAYADDGSSDEQAYAESEGFSDGFDADDDDAAVATAFDAPLDIPAKLAIVTRLGRLFESGGDAYAAINADIEFSDRRFSQYQKWHVGLSYGFVQFTQDSGGLGRLLRMMRDRDPARFREIFGPDADALVDVTNSAGPSGRTVPGGRSVRVQPVGGADLWTEPWLGRFRAAGAHAPFQAAQNELAVRMYLDPVLPFAAGFGLDTERALAVVVDRSIQMGAGGARVWLTRTIGPIRTDALRQQALGVLGHPDVAAFQRSAGLRSDGQFGPVTHAAMTGALRRLGAASPVPIPTREQMLDAIVARADAENRYWRHRPRTLRTSREFTDTVLTWPAPTASP